MTKESYPIKFDLSQYYKIKRIIESSDVFFASLFDLTNIYFSENAQTAQITFDKQGNSLNMEINPHFWSKLQEDEKTFIILHELSHVVYDHGKRIIELGLDFDIANYATDIVINHKIHNNFFVNRESFDWKKYCWVETIFKDEEVPNNKNFEFYYNKIVAQQKFNKDAQLLGNHNPPIKNDKKPGKSKKNKSQENSIPNEAPSMLDEILEENPELMDSLSDSPISDDLKEDFPEIHKKLRAPKGETTENFREVEFEKPKQLPTLKKLLDLIKPKKPKKEYNISETWVGQHRRYASFLKNNPNILLPNIKEIEKKQKKKQKEIWVFMDSSGSCSGMFKEFSSIVVALLKNKDISCRAFSFGDHCKEINPNNLRISFTQGNAGGFDIIENTILQCMEKEKCSYPDNVIVLSDGEVHFSNQESLVKPANWILLLDHQRNKHLTPPGGQFFLLDDNFFDIVPEQNKNKFKM